MRKPIGILASIVVVAGIVSAYAFRPADMELWKTDYLELRDILAASYANIGYASESGLSLRSLDSTAQAELGQANTVRGAKRAISKFVSGFGDPHLHLASEPSGWIRYLANTMSRSPYPSRGASAALAVGVSLVSTVQKPSVPAIDVIVVAHQDDWQLFMGDVVAKQVQAGHRVLFVYLTAGDVGRDSIYWVTRERGVLQSTRIAAGAAAGNRSLEPCSTVRIQDHSIRKCTIANTESYFLRLPDGHRNGIGFARHSFQSLRKLRQRRIASLSAIDGSAAYNGWADLKSTVDSLIGGSSSTRVTVHTSDPSAAVNPHDHFDHRMAGLLVYDSRRKARWNLAYYTGYALATRAANRTGEQVRQKTALFRAYDNVMTEANPKWGAYRERPAFYSQCMMRTYARRITRP